MRTTIHSQRGVSMLGIFLICAVIVLGAVGMLKVIPAYIEFGTIKKAASGSRDGAKTVADVVRGFDKRAQVDDITAISGKDLEVTKDGNETVVRAAWTQRLPLFANYTLLIDFACSTADK